MLLSSMRILARPLCGLVFAALLGPMAAWAEAAPGSISVNVDQAKLMKLPARVSTIVVGNPMIADVTLQNGGIVVVTGKGYGATNFIAMDRSGEVLVDRQIQVEGPTEDLVTVYRGVDQVCIEEVEVPTVGPHEVLVRVGACGVCGTDLKKIHYGFVPPRLFEALGSEFRRHLARRRGQVYRR